MKHEAAELANSAAPRSALVRAWAAWDRFWFLPADPTTLAFIRVCAGALVLYVHIAYAFGLMDFVGPNAWVDAKAMNWLRRDIPIHGPVVAWQGDQQLVAKGYTVWSVYYNVTDPFWAHVVHGAIVLAMFLFMIGLWTRVTAVLSWIGVMCYLERAPTTLFGMDTMMNILMIYLMIGPSGAALSVDRWLQLRRAGWRGGAAPPPAPRVSANFAIRLLQIHFCIVYMASGLSKLLGSAWWSGTAVWYTVANYSFAPMESRWYMAALVWLSQNRVLWELVMSGGVVFTLALEIGLPFLIWLPRWRWLMISGAVLLHTVIGLTMGLVTFGLMMLCMVFSFVPPEAVHQMLDRLFGLKTGWANATENMPRQAAPAVAPARG